MGATTIQQVLAQLFRSVRTSEGQLVVAALGALVYAVADGVVIPPHYFWGGVVLVSVYVLSRTVVKWKTGRDDTPMAASSGPALPPAASPPGNVLDPGAEPLPNPLDARHRLS